MKIIGTIIVALALIFAGYYAYNTLSERDVVAGEVTTFEQCVAAGNPVMESYPRQCRHEDKTFTEEIQANIRVTQPLVNAVVGKNITIKGEARVFENTVNYRVTDSSGLILAEGFTTALSPDVGQFGPFEVTKALKAPATTRGILEVFEISARDGEEVNMASIPVQFNLSDFATTTVKLYFPKKDDPMMDCSVVTAVTRVVPKTEGIARAALEELLKGPNDADDRAGLTTSINNGVRIQKLTIQNGVARVDFDQTLQQNVGGSCRVQSIRSQITQTLRQFTTVKSVIISIDGKTEDILQP